MNKVLVTGIGILSPLGNNASESFLQAVAGISKITIAHKSIRRWLANALVAVVDEDYQQLLQKNESGLDRATQFALIAGREALADASFENATTNKSRIGVFCGIGLSGANIIENTYTRFHEQLQKEGGNPIVMHPLSVPRIMANAPASLLSMEFGFLGACNTYSIACASSATAIGEAKRAIAHGYYDAILIIGTESMLTLGSLIMWNALRVLAKPNIRGTHASCRPFAQDRNGFVLGEGAGALLLESEENAKKRSAKVYAELSGYGCSSDASHITVPSVAGQVVAMNMAMTEARLSPTDIGYINAHGTATNKGDLVESMSIREVFQSASEQIPVSSTKSMHGHMIGAGGAVELALSILAMNNKVILPTAYLDNPDPKCKLNHVGQQAIKNYSFDALLSNSFAFGGSNVSLIAKKYE